MLSKIKIIILSIIFILAGIVLLLIKFEDNKSQQDFSTIQSIAMQDSNTSNYSSTIVDNDGVEDVEFGEIGIGISLDNFNELYQLNNDFYSWILIPNTNINYPVMLSYNNPNFYLNRDFYKNYSSYGVPYIDERYNIESSNNLLIYGHSMQNSTMFSDITKYLSFDFFANNKTIQYTDLTGYTEYEIFSIFSISINDEFDYNNYINMDEIKFDEYIENVLIYNQYNTQIRPKFGDKLMTLSTCENTDDDRRLVLVAYKEDM